MRKSLALSLVLIFFVSVPVYALNLPHRIEVIESQALNASATVSSSCIDMRLAHQDDTNCTVIGQVDGFFTLTLKVFDGVAGGDMTAKVTYTCEEQIGDTYVDVYKTGEAGDTETQLNIIVTDTNTVLTSPEAVTKIYFSPVMCDRMKINVTNLSAISSGNVNAWLEVK